MPRMLARALPWLTAAAGVLALLAVLPPVSSYARQDAFVQALQFVIFAVAVPALLMPGIASLPGRRAWRTSGPGVPSGRWKRAAAPALRLLASTAGHRAEADHRAVRAAAGKMLFFVALVITWRLPAMLDALARYPALIAAELVTLVCAGSAVWADLITAAPLRQPLPRPLRAAMAAVAMWNIWIVAYVTGMSGAAPASRGPNADALNAATDRQLGVAVMWAVPAIFFAPVVYTMVIRWLGERDDPDAELRAAALSGTSITDLSHRTRPPRGWRSPLG